MALPLIALELHLGPSAKGVLLSAFFWSYALMQLPMGWCSDRWNLRWLYVGAFALWSLACGGTGFAGTMAALIVFRILLGIGESVYLPAGMKIVSILFGPQEHGLASGLMNCGTRAGLALGTPLIAWLVVRMPWREAFIVLGFSGLFWLVPWLLVFPSISPRPVVVSRGGKWSGSFPRNLLGLCLGQICYSYYWYLMVTWLPDYLVESRHMPIVQAGSYAVIPYLTFTLSEPLGGWISDRLVRRGWNETASRRILITVAFLTSLMLLPVGLVPNDIGAVLLIGGGSLVGLATANLLALLQRLAPPDAVGMWTGILNFCGNLSGIVAPLATGILIAKTGSYTPGFMVAVAVLLSGLPAYWWIIKDKRDSAPQTTAFARDARENAH